MADMKETISSAHSRLKTYFCAAGFCCIESTRDSTGDSVKRTIEARFDEQGDMGGSSFIREGEGHDLPSAAGMIEEASRPVAGLLDAKLERMERPGPSGADPFTFPYLPMSLPSFQSEVGQRFGLGANIATEDPGTSRQSFALRDRSAS
jgi:hypothetical protein